MNATIEKTLMNVVVSKFSKIPTDTIWWLDDAQDSEIERQFKDFITPITRHYLDYDGYFLDKFGLKFSDFRLKSHTEHECTFISTLHGEVSISSYEKVPVSSIIDNGFYLETVFMGDIPVFEDSVPSIITTSTEFKKWLETDFQFVDNEMIAFVE